MSSLRGLLAPECDIQRLQVELPLWRDGRELEMKVLYAVVVDTWSSGPLQHVPERSTGGPKASSRLHAAGAFGAL